MSHHENKEDKIEEHFGKLASEEEKCDIRKIDIDNNIANIQKHDIGGCDDDYEIF